MEGRYIKTIGYFNAISKEHARIKGSIHKHNIEILGTGFYKARILSESDIQTKILNAKKILNEVQNSINSLENPL